MNSIMKICLVLITLNTVIGCKSEDETKKEIQNFIEIFAQDLSMKNSTKLSESYPKITEIGNCWILDNFKINNIIKSGNEYLVYATYNRNLVKKEINILFNVRLQNDQYVITDSKGLSGYIGKSSYNFFELLGCINENDSDIKVTEFLMENESNYSSMIDYYIEELENKVAVKPEINFNSGYFISGKLIITNNSELIIPEYSYNTIMGFIFQNKLNYGTKEQIMGNKPVIPPHESVIIDIDYIPIPNNFQKCMGLFEINDKEKFSNSINKIIINQLGWDCDKYKMSIANAN